MGLKTKPDNIEMVREFFDQHQRLTGFCHHHRDYRLASDGHRLAFYRPNHQIKAQSALFREKLDLAKQLYECIWPLRS